MTKRTLAGHVSLDSPIRDRSKREQLILKWTNPDTPNTHPTSGMESHYRYDFGFDPLDYWDTRQVCGDLMKDTDHRRKPYHDTLVGLAVGCGRGMKTKWFSEWELKFLLGRRGHEEFPTGLLDHDERFWWFLTLLSKKRLSDDEFQLLLAQDVVDAIAAASRAFIELPICTPNRQIGLVNLAFGQDWDRLEGGRGLIALPEVVQAVNERRWADAAEALEASWWGGAVEARRRKRVCRLLRGRRSED